MVTAEITQIRVSRTFAANADTSLLRAASFEGREHLVVPVVALIGDRVFRPLNSEGPELVPLSELEVAPSCWDSKPVVPDHPGSGTLSACTPEQLESYAFGRIFNARVEDGKLKMDVWLDRSRAAALGGLQQRVIERLDNGETVEVSIGARTVLYRRPGKTADGVSYTFVWSGVYPDHIALLPENAIGACSIEDGCGTPRAASAGSTIDLSTPLTFKETDMTAKEEIDRFLRLFALHTTSDTELRDALTKALFSSEPGFLGVIDVFAEENRVVYYCMDADYNYTMYRANYSTADDGTISFSRRTEVKAVTKYETAERAEETTPSPETLAAEPKAACSCSASDSVPPTSDSNAAALDNKKGVTMSEPCEKVKGLVGRLLANAAAPFVEADRATLETFSLDRLTAIVEKFEADATPAPEPTEAERIAALPADYQRILSRALDAEKKERAAIISALSANEKVKATYSVEVLNAKETDELRGLAEIAGITLAPAVAPINYAGARSFGGVDPAAPVAPEAPKPWSAALAKAKGAAPSTN